ncbi:MAG: aminotransferase class V-fold PLP-dependent enzyme [Atopobiaceae bacterium]|jgi:cysteine desulfurase family protein
MIYLDNAATTMQKPPQVIDAVVNALKTMGNASRGATKASLAASRIDYIGREKLAQLMGCPRPDHVIFTNNSTESLNIAISGLTSAGDKIVSTALEHNSVLRPLYRMQAERGCSVNFARADEKGNLDFSDFERLLTEKPQLVVVTHGSNVTGNMVDIAEVAARAHEVGACVVVDASQTAGCHEVNLEKSGVDVICFTGHKGLMGPQGTGGMCIAEGVEIKPFKVGGTGVKSYSKTQPMEYPTRLEAGTLNSHGIAGLVAALDFIQETGVDTIGAREDELSRRFYEGVSGIDGVTCYGDFAAQERCAIVSINIKDYASSVVSDELSEHFGIATRPGAHCAPLMHESFGTVEQGMVRFSFSWYNTEDDVDAAIAAVTEIAR